MMAQEKNFEQRVKKYLKEQGAYFIKYWGGAEFTKAGVPDLLVCLNGYFLGVELKAPNGKPSDLQLYNLDKIDDAGGYGILLYPKDFDEFKKLCGCILDGGAGANGVNCPNILRRKWRPNSP